MLSRCGSLTYGLATEVARGGSDEYRTPVYATSSGYIPNSKVVRPDLSRMSWMFFGICFQLEVFVVFVLEVSQLSQSLR